MWRRVWLGLIVVGGALVLSVSPAGAKFWQFELGVDNSEIAVGDTVNLKAFVADYGAEEAARLTEIVPPVEVYRTNDLPESEGLPPGIEPAATVQWTNLGDGRYSGKVTLSEPGSYEIVSMGVWNYQLRGYPQPISLTVTGPTPASVAPTRDPWLPIGWLALATAATVALVGLGFVRHRGKAMRSEAR